MTSRPASITPWLSAFWLINLLFAAMAAMSLLGNDHRFLLWWPVLAGIVIVMEWRMPFKVITGLSGVPLPLRRTLLVTYLLQGTVTILSLRTLF